MFLGIVGNLAADQEDTASHQALLAANYRHIGSLSIITRMRVQGGVFVWELHPCLTRQTIRQRQLLRPEQQHPLLLYRLVQASRELSLPPETLQPKQLYDLGEYPPNPQFAGWESLCQVATQLYSSCSHTVHNHHNRVQGFAPQFPNTAGGSCFSSPVVQHPSS